MRRMTALAPHALVLLHLRKQMAIPSPPAVLDDSLGAALLGNLAAAILYGVTSSQTWYYYKHSTQDSTLLRSSIFVLWILDCLHLALITYAVYTSAVTDFADPMALISPVWSLKAHVAVAGLIDAIVRSLFCHRMWNLSKGNWPLTIVIGTGTCIAFAGSIAFSIRAFAVIGNVFQLSQLSRILYTSLAAGIFVDVLVAASLCLLLTHIHSGFPSTQNLVLMLMIYSINTGALTSLCEISCLITYATMHSSLCFMALFFVLPKLLLNALLATLNARVSLRKAGGTSIMSSEFTAKSPHQSIRHSNRAVLGHSGGLPESPRMHPFTSPVANEFPKMPQKSRPATMSKVYSVDLESGKWTHPFHPRPREAIL